MYSFFSHTVDTSVTWVGFRSDGGATVERITIKHKSDEVESILVRVVLPRFVEVVVCGVVNTQDPGDVDELSTQAHASTHDFGACAMW